MAAMTLSASAVLAFDGMPERFTQPVDKMASFLSYNALTPMREGKCFLTSRFMSMAMFDKNDCLRMDKSRPNYLLIGDSHAADLWAGLHDRFPGINVMQATASGCRPILGSGGEPRCTNLMNFIFTNFLPTHHVDGLVLSARWEDHDTPGVSAILISIPPEEQVEQITRMSGYLQRAFGSAPAGAWLAERVWEPQLPHALSLSNVRYTLVDDVHFIAAGFESGQLHGDYVCEERGRTVRVFPGLKTLRYLLPFRSVEEAIGYLRELRRNSSWRHGVDGR